MKVCPACKRTFEDDTRYCPHDASLLPSDVENPDGDSLIGTLLADTYRVHARIGEGGMGRVYEASHERLGTRVAVKIVRPEFARNSTVVQRFQREAQAAASIGNEHIIEVLDVNTTPEGRPYIVMEYLDGQDLRSLLAAGPLSIADTVHYVAQIADALTAAHKHHIIHRDLKPDNVFLLDRGGKRNFVKVLDFGVSKMQTKAPVTQDGSAVGTPNYMSPEQILAEVELDSRSDLFALGAMTYEMLTGRVPFDNATPAAVMVSIVTKDARLVLQLKDRLPEGISDVVAKAVARTPDGRFASTREFAAALAKVAEVYHGATVPGAPTDDSYAQRIEEAEQGRAELVTALAIEPIGAYLPAYEGTAAGRTHEERALSLTDPVYDEHHELKIDQPAKTSPSDPQETSVPGAPDDPPPRVTEQKKTHPADSSSDLPPAPSRRGEIAHTYGSARHEVIRPPRPTPRPRTARLAALAIGIMLAGVATSLAGWSLRDRPKVENTARPKEAPSITTALKAKPPMDAGHRDLRSPDVGPVRADKGSRTPADLAVDVALPIKPDLSRSIKRPKISRPSIRPGPKAKTKTKGVDVLPVPF